MFFLNWSLLVFANVPNDRLVPGDLIEIDSHHTNVMTCDAVLLNGNCVVDESMLTGKIFHLKNNYFI